MLALDIPGHILLGEETLLPVFRKKFGTAVLSCSFNLQIDPLVTHPVSSVIYTSSKLQSTSFYWSFTFYHTVIYKDEGVVTTQIDLQPSLLNQLSRLCACVPLLPSNAPFPVKVCTPITRVATKSLIELARMSFVVRTELERGHSAQALGESLHRQWQLRKRLNPLLKNSQFNRIYRKVRKDGIIGGTAITFNNQPHFFGFARHIA